MNPIYFNLSLAAPELIERLVDPQTGASYEIPPLPSAEQIAQDKKESWEKNPRRKSRSPRKNRRSRNSSAERATDKEGTIDSSIESTEKPSDSAD